ncbi:MAG: hypothetical protein GY805_36215, partial [Chloroflexi bacterium]|nr:hypothetical protein [Chloroflexota bacterium]
PAFVLAFSRRIVVKLLLFLSLAAILLLMPDPARSAVPLTQIAYWKFDEIRGTTFSDTWAKRDGFCAESCPNAIRGIDHAAQSFDGTAGINIPIQEDFSWNNQSEFSIEFWMKAEPGKTCTTTDEVIVGWGNEVLGGWSLGCSAENGRAQFWLADARGHSAVLHSNRVVTDGRWHHFVGIRDGINEVNTLIVDGTDIVAATQRYVGVFGAGTDALQVGAWVENGRFVGVVDELSLYEGVLTQNEILTHYYLARAYGDGCTTQVNIMPLGNSITRGYGSGSNPTNPSFNYGYRLELDNLLTTANNNFDFIGSLNDGGPSGVSFDFDHEGRGGFRADQIATWLSGYLTLNPPELVLLHIGTNDIAQENDTSVTDVNIILDGIDTFDEQITVILALIVDQKPDDPKYMAGLVDTFNTNLQALAQSRTNNGDKIILVNQNNALTYPDDMFDWLHPNESGYNKMADVWFNALQNILPHCTTPVINSTPTTTAFVSQPYVYDVNAAGDPTTTFALTDAPNGMSIDPDTGLISWTPMGNQRGSHAVEVEASNSFGIDTQSFVILVEYEYEIFLPIINRNP